MKGKKAPQKKSDAIAAKKKAAPKKADGAAVKKAVFVKELFKKLDTNGDGVLTFEEFSRGKGAKGQKAKKPVKKAAGAKKSHGKDKINYDAIAKKLEAAVKAGKLTEEEAKAKWAAIKKAADAKDKRDD